MLSLSFKSSPSRSAQSGQIQVVERIEHLGPGGFEVADIAGDYREVMLDSGGHDEEIDVKVPQRSAVAALTEMTRSSNHVLVCSNHTVRSRANSGLRRR